MKQKVNILTQLTTQLNGQSELIRNNFIGTWQQMAERHLLLHDEPENKGNARILLTPFFADIHRKGDSNSSLRLKTNTHHPFNYTTPHGNMAFMVHTQSYALNITPNSGRMEATYELWAGDTLVTKNEIIITWSLLN